MSASTSYAHPRILIVDDAEEAREILATALRTIHGSSVDTTENAENALLSMRQDRVDVLVTDYRMTGMTGIDLLIKLRECGCWPSCGVVVISGESDPELPRRALASGARVFFSKPFSAGAVRKSVISLLEECDGVA
jgi:DNA-binding NtrC family response regulator